MMDSRSSRVLDPPLSRGLAVLLRPAPGLTAAQPANAAFDAQRIGAGERDMAGVAFAVMGVVDLARPFVLTGRAHPAEQGQADHRAPGQRGIGVLVTIAGFPVAGSIGAFSQATTPQ